MFKNSIAILCARVALSWEDSGVLERAHIVWSCIVLVPFIFTILLGGLFVMLASGDPDDAAVYISNCLDQI